MSRTCGNDTTLDGLTNQSHVANYIEQLVACAFVLPYQRFVLYVTQFGGITMFYVQHVCKHVKTFLGGLTLIHHDGIVKVTTLDEVGLQQRFNIPDKHESTCRGYLLRIIQDVVKCGKL